MKNGEITIALGICIAMAVVALLTSVKIIRDDIKKDGGHSITNMNYKACTE